MSLVIIGIYNRKDLKVLTFSKLKRMLGVKTLAVANTRTILKFGA